MKIIEDAKQEGYDYLEAYPYVETLGLLQTLGDMFQCINNLVLKFMQTLMEK